MCQGQVAISEKMAVLVVFEDVHFLFFFHKPWGLKQKKNKICFSAVLEWSYVTYVWMCVKDGAQTCGVRTWCELHLIGGRQTVPTHSHRSGHHIPSMPSGGNEETRAQVSEAVKQDSMGPRSLGGIDVASQQAKFSRFLSKVSKA
jgi:hypothetical protein